MLRLSIAITNHNYEDYVGQAIDSALKVDWPNKEVIVVDDGSTDRSRSIIKSYGRRVNTIYQPNGGMASAVNAAFQQVTGDVVIFLDADDKLKPEVANQVAEMWDDAISKVQWLMAYIDRDGRPTGDVYPNHQPQSPEQIKRAVLEAGAYSTAFTSANAYSKKFLDRVMPLPEHDLPGIDTYLNTLAPLAGNVIDLDKAMTYYRIHGKNDWASTGFDEAKFLAQYRKELGRLQYLHRMAPLFGARVDVDRVVYHNSHLLAHRLAYRVLDPEADLPPNDSRLSLLWRILRMPRRESLLSHVVFLTWVTAVAVLPKRLALTTLKYRMVPSSRPAFMVRALKKLGVLRIAA